VSACWCREEYTARTNKPPQPRLAWRTGDLMQDADADAEEDNPGLPLLDGGGPTTVHTTSARAVSAPRSRKASAVVDRARAATADLGALPTGAVLKA